MDPFPSIDSIESEPTQQRIAELEAQMAQLRAERDHLKRLFEQAPLAYQSLDSDGCFLDVNQAWTNTLGYTREEVIGRNFAEFLHPDWQNHFRENFQKFKAIGEIVGVEFEMAQKDGTFLTVSFHGKIGKTPEGRFQQTHCIFQDISSRKRDEQALRESEERFRALHNASFGGIVIHDQGIILDCNQGLVEQTGYSLDELIGMDGFALIAPESLEVVKDNIRRGYEQPYQVVGLRKDGSRYPVSIRGTIIPYKGRKVRVTEFRDITEYKRLEEALEKRLVTLTCPLTDANGITFEDLFDPALIQQIQDEFAAATGVASIITRPDGTPITEPSNFTQLCRDIIRTTEKGCANCFKSDAVIGRYHPGGPIVQPCLSGGLWDAGASITVGGHHVANWLIGQVRNETQSEDAMRSYARSIDADEAAFMEAFGQVPSMSSAQFGRIAQALYTLANQLSNSAYQNIQQARSITERKQAEEALRKSEERFRLAMEATKDGLWDWDILTGQVYYSPGYWSMLGYDAASQPRSAEAWIDIVHPDDREAVLAANDDCIANRSDSFVLEYRMRTSSGEWKWIQERGTAVVRDDQGRARRMIGTHIDITERKHAEEERERLKGQLLQAQKMEAVARLAGGVAHDFNNMLAVIQGHAELALMRMGPDDPSFRHFSAIRDTANRSAELTQQLLAFARKQVITPIALDLNKAVESMLKMLRRFLGEDIDLKWNPKKGLWTIKADPTQIDQIVADLCINARDAISGVGTIIVATDNCSIDREYCATHAGFLPGDFVRITVSDNGCGMDKQMLSQIFEPFFTTKELGKGTGLGLATVYGAIRQNEGFVNVYSELGQGSVFSIYFPRYLGESQQKPVDSKAGTTAGGHETILLVEDELVILETVTDMLEQLGYTVLAASIPNEAIQLARQHPEKIDLLLTDVIMPQMNGRDLANQLLAGQPWMKCLFMSGYTADIIAYQGKLDEDVHFIQKPFSLSTLATKIRQTLET